MFYHGSFGVTILANGVFQHGVSPKFKFGIVKSENWKHEFNGR
jgi:hypothetical protein